MCDAKDKHFVCLNLYAYSGQNFLKPYQEKSEGFTQPLNILYGFISGRSCSSLVARWDFYVPLYDKTVSFSESNTVPHQTVRQRKLHVDKGRVRTHQSAQGPPLCMHSITKVRKLHVDKKRCRTYTSISSGSSPLHSTMKSARTGEAI